MWTDAESEATTMIISVGGVSLGGMASVRVWVLPRMGLCGALRQKERAATRPDSLCQAGSTAQQQESFSRQKLHKSISG